MSHLTLQLPETLHQQLIHLAEGEGISVSQYIVYLLTRQVSALTYRVQATPVEEIHQQKQAFEALLNQLGTASPAELQAVLDQREVVPPEPDLNPEIIAQFQQRLRDAAKDGNAH